VIDDGADLLFGDADEHDRLVMLHEPGANEFAGGVERDEDMDRLARIAGGIDEVGIEIGEPEQPVALKDRRQRRCALGRAKAVRPVDQISRLDPAEKLREPGVRCGCQPCDRDKQERQQHRPACCRVEAPNHSSPLPPVFGFNPAAITGSSA
jgi:hypothetical protein